MFKLVRNALKKVGSFYTIYGVVKFAYFEQLVAIQEALNFKLGNKLTRGHVEFEGDKMKTKLSVQLFSRAVANSLKFLRDIGIKEFQGCDATIKFCEMMDAIFDHLNSRSANAEGNKKAVTRKSWIQFCEANEFYISYLMSIEVQQFPKGNKNSKNVNVLKHSLYI
jgi:hypothetical protein